MRRAVEKQFGSLKCLTLEGAVGGPCVVLFHGYGADSSDLLPLAEMMNSGPHITWVFPDAPLEVIIAPGFYGKAWYQIDMKRLEQAMVNGEPADLTQTKPPGLEEARKRAATLYDDLRAKHSHLVLGGFSQGAILTMELAFTQTKKPSGLVLMSGALIDEKRWSELAPSCEGLTFIQTHGKNDALLGYEFAEKLRELLDRSGLHGEFVSFSGGHEIPPKAVEKIASYLKSCLKTRH
jgi:phospholipase/carboxylesterase